MSLLLLLSSFCVKVGLKGKVTLEEYTAAYDALLPELLPNCRMMPGAMRFVQHLARHNIPFAICTGSRSMECDLKLRNLKHLTDLVPLMVSFGILGVLLSLFSVLNVF